MVIKWKDLEVEVAIVLLEKKGERTITIPKHDTTKTVYVLMVKDVIEMEEKKHENN